MPRFSSLPVHGLIRKLIWFDKKEDIYCMEKKENIVEQVIRIVCYISLPLILLMALTVAGSINTDVNNAITLQQVALSFSLPMLLALVVIPLLIKTLCQKTPLEALGFKKPTFGGIIFCMAAAVVTFASAAVISGRNDIRQSVYVVAFHFFIVAVSEEIMLRGILMDELEKVFGGKILCCILDGLIFAFVYHSSEPPLANLFIRFPLGFVLGYCRIKSGEIYSPIMLHWAYNMFVSAL